MNSICAEVLSAKYLFASHHLFSCYTLFIGISSSILIHELE